MAYETPTFVTIELERGDTYTAKATVYLDGVAVDLNDFEILWAIKGDSRDAASVYAKLKSLSQITIDGVDTNVCYLHLTAAESRVFVPGRVYVWSVRIEHNSTGVTATPFKGELVANREVGRIA